MYVGYIQKKRLRETVVLSTHSILAYMFQMSPRMRFPTMWYVRPSKPQISLRIRAVWSEPLLVD